MGKKIVGADKRRDREGVGAIEIRQCDGREMEKGTRRVAATCGAPEHAPVTDRLYEQSVVLGLSRIQRFLWSLCAINSTRLSVRHLSTIRRDIDGVSGERECGDTRFRSVKCIDLLRGSCDEGRNNPRPGTFIRDLSDSGLRVPVTLRRNSARG